MKKALLKRTQRVHFGEAEDLLSTSFFNEELGQVPEEEKDEEEKKKEEIKSRVQQALGADDVSMLKHLLVEIPDLVDNYLHRPLAHLAAEHGALKILQECVSKPADSINAATSDFEATTPLFWAIREGKADVVDWLLSNGAFHQPLNVYQDSAVYVAVYHNQIDILSVLHAHKCDCNMPNRNGDLPLMHVVRTGNSKALDRLIEMGVDIYGRTANGRIDMEGMSSPLHWVVARHPPSALSTLKTLLESPGFVASEQQPFLCNLISLAVPSDSVDTVSFLFNYIEDKEALLDFQSKAISWSALEVLRYLYVENNVPPDIKRVVRFGSTAGLRLALANAGSAAGSDIIYQCIKRCWERSGRSSRWNSYYIHFETLQRLELLLDHGADLNTVSSETQLSPIFFATKTTHLCVVLWLLRAGCDMRNPRPDQCPIVAALNGLSAYFFHPNILKVAFLMVGFLPTHNDPAISTYLAKVKSTDGILMQSDTNQPAFNSDLSHREENEMLFDEFNAFLTEKSSNPTSLQHQSRFVILQALGTNANRKVKFLNLPPRIKAYIMLQDLEEMCDALIYTQPREEAFQTLDHSSTCLCDNYSVNSESRYSYG